MTPTRPRRPPGRPLNPRSRALTLRVTPSDGIKDELAAASKRHNVPERDIAVAVLAKSRGTYDLIAQLLVAERHSNNSSSSL